MRKEVLLAMLCASCTSSHSTKDVTQERIDRLLAEVAEKPAPDEVVSFAMCYESFSLPERIEYVCPICGAKTIHVKEAAEAEWKGRYHRKKLKEVRKLGLNVTLDERAFCDSCRKKTDIHDGVLGFYVNVTVNGKVARTLVDELDWQRLIAFLEGKDTWTYQDWEGGSDYTKPLKPELPRIRELLGTAP